MRLWTLLFALTLCASAASAEPASAEPTSVESASAEPASAEPASEPNRRDKKLAMKLVKKKLLKPLQKREAKRSMFSRMARAPAERRVRVLTSHIDVRGKTFLSFTVDDRHRWSEEKKWREGSYTGCVYVEDKAVFVQAGPKAEFRPARAMLGKKTKAVGEHICVPAAAQLEQHGQVATSS